MKKPVRFKLRPLMAYSLLMGACIIPSLGYADDIDLFLKPTTGKSAPNVLLVFDNNASNSSSIKLLDNTSGSKFDLMTQIMKIIANPEDLNTLFPDCKVSPEIRDADGEVTTKAIRVPEGCTTRKEAAALIFNINLGVMMINPDNNKNNGGYIFHHVTSMKEDANRKALWDKMSSGVAKEGGGAAYGKMMLEAYRYFAGEVPYVGFSTTQYDPRAKDGTKVVPTYLSPANNYCQNNYILFFGDGTPDSGENNDAEAELKKLNGVLAGDTSDSWFDEYARTLKERDVQSSVAGIQNIITHTILVQEPNDDPKGPILGARALMQKAALNGGGEYALGQDGAAVLKAFFNSLRKMQSADSVFAAVTLPVSVNVRGTFLNQVYMGQFRPDENAKPRWPGNLKQYQIYTDANDKPILADRNKKPVEDKANGFLLPDITSFWTSTSEDWKFANELSPSDAPDGSVVEKGGAAQKMRNGKHAMRNIYTCNGNCVSGNDLSLVKFDTANLDGNGPTVAKLGVADAAERTALINWVRGEDNKDDENENGDLTDNRAYIHGDLLHSRPAVVNYNRYGGNNDIMVYYGTNDGIFHAVKGGQEDLTGAGNENWGIVFPEFLGKLKNLRDNDEVITKETPKPYFADGSVSVYQNDLDSRDGIGSGDKAYIYIGMRRGGRFAYALDVTNPDNPKHLWKIDTSTSSLGTKPFAKMGQTWSTLRAATINRLTTGPAIIMGGGYDDLNEDKIPATANTMGQGIYVLNGSTGKLIKHIMVDGMGSMPADLTVLDRDENGKADRIYAPDTKGNIWRVDIDNADPDKWAVHHIAALGKAADGTQLDARKFLNKIDILFHEDSDTILVGSGDREHPDDMTVTDRFYMLKDTNIGLVGGKICLTDKLPVTCTHAHLTDVTTDPKYQTGSLPAESNGWYLTFEPGEKVINSPVTVNDTVVFGTNVPKAPKDGVCGNLGEARLYQIGYKTGNAMGDVNKDNKTDAADRYGVVKGGGFLPTGVYSPTMVIKDGKEKRIDTVCIGTVCINVPGKNLGSTRQRTYWYRKQ